MQLHGYKGAVYYQCQGNTHLNHRSQWELPRVCGQGTHYMPLVMVHIPRTSVGNRIAVISTAKNRMDVTYEAISLPGVDSEEMKSMCQRDIPIPMVGAAMFMITRRYSIYFSGAVIKHSTQRDLGHLRFILA